MWKAVLYFSACFALLNFLLLARLARLRGSTDEKKKSKEVLGGMVAHFVSSFLVIAIYYFLLYDGAKAHAIVALAAYGASLAHYAVRASKLG